MFYKCVGVGSKSQRSNSSIKSRNEVLISYDSLEKNVFIEIEFTSA